MMRRSNTLRSVKPAFPTRTAKLRLPGESSVPHRPNVWIGPAGWSYTDWRGIVYPSYPHGSGKELETVAETFDVVEINTSFYRPLRPEITRVWLRKCAVNPRFRFTAKLYRRFTHERDASADEEREFKDGIAPLIEAGKLGALLLQFPWSFKNAPENRQYLAGLLLRLLLGLLRPSLDWIELNDPLQVHVSTGDALRVSAVLTGEYHQRLFADETF